MWVAAAEQDNVPFYAEVRRALQLERSLLGVEEREVVLHHDAKRCVALRDLLEDGHVR